MLRILFPVVLAASVAQPFISHLYVGPISNWMAPRPTMLSIGQVIVARFLCLALSLLTVSILIVLALVALKIPQASLIVLCSTLALFSTTSASFVGLARHSRVGFFLLNAILYLSVYAIFYWLFVHAGIPIIGKIGGGLAAAALLFLCSSQLWISLDTAFYWRGQLSIVRNFDFTVYAPARLSGKIKLEHFVAYKNSSDIPAYLELHFVQGVDLYETRLTTAFNPPDDCGPFLPGSHISLTQPCKRAFVTPKGREVYMQSYAGSTSKDYYFRMGDTLITFRQSGVEPTAFDPEEFVDSFEPTGAKGLYTSSRSFR